MLFSPLMPSFDCIHITTNTFYTYNTQPSSNDQYLHKQEREKRGDLLGQIIKNHRQRY